MKRYLIIEGDALDLMRMHRKSAMARGPAAPQQPEFEPEDDGFSAGEQSWFNQGEDMGGEDPFLDDLARKPDDAPADIELDHDIPGFEEMGEDLDDGFGGKGDMPNKVKPQEVPEPNAAGGYTEEPVEMPWSGHAVRGNADFGPDHGTEESTIIDPEEGGEFKGGHPDEYEKASEQEGFGGTSEE